MGELVGLIEKFQREQGITCDRRMMSNEQLRLAALYILWSPLEDAIYAKRLEARYGKGSTEANKEASAQAQALRRNPD